MRLIVFKKRQEMRSIITLDHVNAVLVLMKELM